MKKKSMKEIRLEEYLGGFYDCLGLIEQRFREEFWASYRARSLAGKSTFAEDCETEVSKALWGVIEPAQKFIHEKDSEYKDLVSARLNS
jgi:hypothetical protein